jgi:hypothetical protein
VSEAEGGFCSNSQVRKKVCCCVKEKKEATRKSDATEGFAALVFGYGEKKKVVCAE